MNWFSSHFLHESLILKIVLLFIRSNANWVLDQIWRELPIKVVSHKKTYTKYCKTVYAHSRLLLLWKNRTKAPTNYLSSVVQISFMTYGYWCFVDKLSEIGENCDRFWEIRIQNELTCLMRNEERDKNREFHYLFEKTMFVCHFLHSLREC